MNTTFLIMGLGALALIIYANIRNKDKVTKKSGNNLPVFKNSPSVPPKSIQTFKEKMETYKNKRHHYYLDVIISLIEGSVKQFSGVINLECVSYGYYSLDDVIIYYNNDIKDALLAMGIASYNDSSGGLVITIDEDRVNNMRKEGEVHVN
jgi:hypothetical protein